GTIHGGKQLAGPDVSYSAAVLYGLLTYLDIPGVPGASICSAAPALVRRNGRLSWRLPTRRPEKTEALSTRRSTTSARLRAITLLPCSMSRAAIAPSRAGRLQRWTGLGPYYGPRLPPPQISFPIT